MSVYIDEVCDCQNETVVTVLNRLKGLGLSIKEKVKDFTCTIILLQDHSPTVLSRDMWGWILFLSYWPGSANTVTVRQPVPYEADLIRGTGSFSKEITPLVRVLSSRGSGVVTTGIDLSCRLRLFFPEIQDPFLYPTLTVGVARGMPRELPGVTERHGSKRPEKNRTFGTKTKTSRP